MKNMLSLWISFFELQFWIYNLSNIVLKQSSVVFLYFFLQYESKMFTICWPPTYPAFTLVYNWPTTHPPQYVNINCEWLLSKHIQVVNLKSKLSLLIIVNHTGWEVWLMYQGHRKLLQSGWARPKILLLLPKIGWANAPFL